MLINPTLLFNNARARQDAAKQIVQHYDESGHAFALFLTRWEPITIFYGDDAQYLLYGEEAQAPESLSDKLGRYLLQLGIPMLMVRHEDYADSVVAWLPALELTNDTWQEEVCSLVGKADLIFYQMLYDAGEGVLTELEMIRAGNKEQCTIIMLPTFRQEESFMKFSSFDKDAQLLQGFPRVAYTHEIVPDSLIDSPLTGDLIIRMIGINNVPLPQRLQLRAPSLRRSEFPLPSQVGSVSIGEQLLSLAMTHERYGNIEKALSALRIAKDFFVSLADEEKLDETDKMLKRLSESK